MPYNLVNVFFLFFAEVSEAPIFPLLPNMFVTFLCSNVCRLPLFQSVAFLYSNLSPSFRSKTIEKAPAPSQKERTDAVLPNEQAK